MKSSIIDDSSIISMPLDPALLQQIRKMSVELNQAEDMIDSQEQEIKNLNKIIKKTSSEYEMHLESKKRDRLSTTTKSKEQQDEIDDLRDILQARDATIEQERVRSNRRYKEIEALLMLNTREFSDEKSALEQCCAELKKDKDQRRAEFRELVYFHRADNTKKEAEHLELQLFYQRGSAENIELRGSVNTLQQEMLALKQQLQVIHTKLNKIF